MSTIPIPASVDAVLDFLKARTAVRRIILFGSRAHGDADPRSDVDLAISAPDLDASATARLRDAVSSARTLYKVSVTRLEDMSPRLRLAVLGNGRTLYERPQAEG